MRIKDLSIRTKLILMQVFIAFVVLSAYSVFHVIRDAHAYRNEVHKKLDTLARLVGFNCLPALNFLDPIAAEQDLKSLQAEENILGGWIYDADDNIFARYVKKGASLSVPPNPPAGGENWKEMKPDSFFLRHEILQDGEVAGTVVLLYDREPYRKMILHMNLIGLAILAGGLVVALVLSIFTHRALSRPILHLVSTVNRISESGDTSIRVERERKDEIGDLYDRFNEMLYQLTEKEGERDRAELALRESEEKYRTLVERAKDGIVILQNGRIAYANPSLVEMSGGPGEEILGRPFKEFLSEEDAEKLEQLYDLRMSGQEVASMYETVFIPRDGHRIHAEVNASLIRYRGEPADLVVIRNINERKKAEAQIRDLNKELQERILDLQKTNEALKSFNDMVDTLHETRDFPALIDRAVEIIMRFCKSDGAVFFSYDAEESILRLLRGKGVGEESIKAGQAVPVEGSLTGLAVLTRDVSVSSHLGADDRLFPGAQKALDQEGFTSMLCFPVVFEDRVLGAFDVLFRDRKKPGNMQRENLLAIGKTIGLAMVNAERMAQIQREIEERKKAQDELKQAHDRLEERVAERTRELEEANERLKELDRLKSMFLASMSHELRTPLNSIIGFTGLLLMGMSGELSEEQKRQLTMVKKSADHLLSLINDILDISKIESGKVDLDVEELDLEDIISAVVASVAPQAKEKSLDLDVRVENGIVVQSDRRRLTQIIMNLVSNAIKFTEQGTVTLSAASDAGHAEVAVTDTGIGIREEEMTKLFRPFQQADMSSTRRFEGTGLGLYLSWKLVHMLGGEIRAESEFGEGSTFTFTIPLAWKEEA